ncbi:cytochrome c3 family protein [Helicobacter salomonis]|uniref:cytochrome c3 family protein n=1 Tax=Helicobacter salomonis TaxID=56878 RepID=UPI000CF0980E|nr:NapC/NirT family cytochrome c [Helicobacter salomonis]
MDIVETLKGKRYLLFWIFVGGCMAGVFLSVLTVQAVEWTADDKFCGICHIMKPEIDAYHLDKHGGNNAVGFKARCVDCHLPHNNVVSYFVRKAILGMEDVYGNVFKDPNKLDWEKNRRRATEYVFDSGCLHCHSSLMRATSSNMKSFLPHRDYFEGLSQKKCVECHLDEVGHKNLGLHLREYLKDNYKPYPRDFVIDGKQVPINAEDSTKHAIQEIVHPDQTFSKE